MSNHRLPAVALLGLCGGPGALVPCSEGDPCPGVQVCLAGFCRLPCGADRDCPSGQECRHGLCLPPDFHLDATVESGFSDRTTPDLTTTPDQSVPDGGTIDAMECVENWADLHPEWIFCDDFEGTAPLIGYRRWFEFSNGDDDHCVPTAGLGPGGSRGMPSVWSVGERSACNLKLGFGRCPNDYIDNGIAPTEDFRDVHYRQYIKMQEGWQGLGYTRGITPLFDGAHNGVWYCVEAHVRLNDPGQANGVLELWVDGAQEAQRSGLDLVGSYQDYAINGIFFEHYWVDGSPYAQTRYFDNIVVSRTRIGCL